VDIPFIRLAFPLLILYGYWYAFVSNPWVDQPFDPASNDPNYLSQQKAQTLVDESRALIAQNKFEEALIPLQRLHKGFPENHIYLQSLAETYDHLSRYKDANEMWEQYLLYSPTPIEGCPQVGLDYRRQGKEAEALKAFERCHAIEENSDTLLFYGNALERQGQFAKALELYQKAIESTPHYADVGVSLARVEARLGQAAAAKPRIDEILKTRPDDPEALIAAGVVYSALGQRSAALRFLEHARTLSPDYKDIAVLMRMVRRNGGM
jgi:tetratricopeptide (TPR) repeat protein